MKGLIGFPPKPSIWWASLQIFALLCPGVHAQESDLPIVSVPLITWYDTFAECAPISEREKQGAFRRLQYQWQDKGRIVSADSISMETWYEPIPDSLPITVRVARGTLGLFYTKKSKCREALFLESKIRWITPKTEIPTDRKWYRAILHRNSCDLPPLQLADITSWFIRSFFGDSKTDVEFRMLKGPLGLALFTGDKTKTLQLADTKEGCEFLLKDQKERIPKSLLTQFGWDSGDK